MNKKFIFIWLRTTWICALAIACAGLILVDAARAQTTSVYERKGASLASTEVRRGEVVYVSGRELIVKMDDGQTKYFTVPQGFRFNVDGRQLSVSQLRPGMRLTQQITTTTTPKTIITVRQVSGKVWYVNAPRSVILTLPDGTNKQFTVPDKAKFEIGGREKTVFDLRKGMQVTATAITQVPETEVTRQSTVTGSSASLAQTTETAVAMPPSDQVGTVLVEDSSSTEAIAAAEETGGEPAPRRLPKTGTSLPLLIMFGTLSLAVAMGLRTTRKALRWN